MSMVKKQTIYDFISFLAFIEKGRLTRKLGKGTQKISWGRFRPGALQQLCIVGHLFDPMS